MPVKKIIALLSLIFAVIPVYALRADTLAGRLQGRILLQVEDKGQAWYIEPETQKRAFLGRPADAFKIMRELGLGITEKDYTAWNGTAPERLAGRILLRVQAHGEAYYVDPLDLKLYSLGRPADAFAVMREFGLGITDLSLNTIQVNEKYAEPAPVTENPETADEPAADETAATSTDSSDTAGETTDASAATTTEPAADETSATSTPDTATSTAPVCQFQADYYRNIDLTSRVVSRVEDSIDYDWGEGSPEGVPLQNRFSARWTATCHFDAGRYRFIGVFNDAVKASVGSWRFNSWRNNFTDVTIDEEVDFTADDYYIRIEFYDYLGVAKAQFRWEKVE